MYCKLCADIDSKINTLIMNVQFITVYAQTSVLRFALCRKLKTTTAPSSGVTPPSATEIGALGR